MSRIFGVIGLGNLGFYVIEASVLITVILLNRGIENIIVKAVNSLHEEVLKRLGVKRIIFPERDTGIRLARNLLTGIIQDIPFAKDFSIFKIKAPEKFTGKTLRELDLKRKI